MDDEELREYKNKCRDILSDWDNDWAFDTIQGIYDWIIEKDFITEKQKEAIDNILEKINEKEY